MELAERPSSRSLESSGDFIDPEVTRVDYHASYNDPLGQSGPGAGADLILKTELQHVLGRPWQ